MLLVLELLPSRIISTNLQTKHHSLLQDMGLRMDLHLFQQFQQQSQAVMEWPHQGKCQWLACRELGQVYPALACMEQESQARASATMSTEDILLALPRHPHSSKRLGRR